jgi:hypothetical protein
VLLSLAADCTVALIMRFSSPALPFPLANTRWFATSYYLQRPVVPVITIVSINDDLIFIIIILVLYLYLVVNYWLFACKNVV